MKKLILLLMLAFLALPAQAQFSRISSITLRNNNNTQAAFYASPFVVKAGANCTWAIIGTEATFNCGAAGGGVTSLNGLSGAVTLAAGSGISLTPVGNTITIASTSTTAPGTPLSSLQWNNAGVFDGVEGSVADANGQISLTAVSAIRTPLSVIGFAAQTATLGSFNNSSTGAALGIVSIRGNGLGNCSNTGVECLLELNQESNSFYATVFRNAASATLDVYTSMGQGSNGIFQISSTDDNIAYQSLQLDPTAFSGAGGVLSNVRTSAPALELDVKCVDAAGSGTAACGTAPAGFVLMDAGVTSLVVSTNQVNFSTSSTIAVEFDSSLGTILGVTCNPIVSPPTVTTRVAGTSFTITVPSAPVTNPACYSFTMF